MQLQNEGVYLSGKTINLHPMIRKQYTAHHKFILCKRHEEKYVQVHYHGVTMVWFLSFRYHSILWLFVLPSTYKTFIEHFFILASLYYYLHLPLIAYPFLCVWILISKIPLTSSQRRHISKNVFQMSLSSHHAI